MCILQYSFVPFKWRHMNAMASQIHGDLIAFKKFRRITKASKVSITGFTEINELVTGGIPSQGASNAENVHVMTSSWVDGLDDVYICGYACMWSCVVSFLYCIPIRSVLSPCANKYSLYKYDEIGNSSCTYHLRDVYGHVLLSQMNAPTYYYVISLTLPFIYHNGVASTRQWPNEDSTSGYRWLPSTMSP